MRNSPLLSDRIAAGFARRGWHYGWAVVAATLLLALSASCDR